MDWRHIRHVPVEDNDGRLVGLVTHRGLLRLLMRGAPRNGAGPMVVRDIMKTDPVTVGVYNSLARSHGNNAHAKGGVSSCGG